RTCRTSACALHRRGFTLDRSDDPRIVEPRDRSDTDDLHLDGTDLSSPLSTCLASPFVYHGNDVEPLITHPSGTDCHRRYRRKNLPARSAPADHCQDRWCPTVRRGNDESHSGIRISEGS